MTATKHDLSVEPCPICGGAVETEVVVKTLEPKVNLYGDSWVVEVRFKASCPTCLIKQDTSISDVHVLDGEQDQKAKDYEKELLDFWNNLPRRREVQE